MFKMDSSNKSALVSVIVPVYGVEQYLNKCVDSIINQTYKNLEIILVNDGSLDNCGKICDEYAEKDNRVKVIHKKNGGQGSARNCALRVASGEYITFVDSDDWLALDIIESLYNAIIINEADLSVCGFSSIKANEVLGEYWVCKKPESFDKIQALSVYYEGKYIYPAPWGKLYKRQLWEGVYFPEDVYREDEYIFYKVLEGANKVIHIGVAKYYYNVREGSAEHCGFTSRNLISNVSIDIQYDYISQRYPELHEKVWDSRIQKRIIQLEDMMRAGRYNKYKDEFKEMLKFIEKHEPYSRKLKVLCENIIRYKSWYYLPLRIKNKIKTMLMHLKLLGVSKKFKKMISECIRWLKTFLGD